MDKTIANPTSIAKGNAFIGRDYYIKEITTICLENDLQQYDSIALHGYKKCGKSSLIHYTLDKYLQEKYERIQNGHPMKENLLIVRVELLKNGMDFIGLWRNIISELKKEMIGDFTARYILGGETKRKAKEKAEEFFAQLYREEFEAFFAVREYGADFTDVCEALFEKLAKSKYRLLLFIDTFDYIGDVFGKQAAYFQYINSIKDNYETYKITFLLSSRRSVRDLETKSLGSSVYFDKFRPMALGGFNQQELKEYEQAIENYYVVLNEEEREKLHYYCGNSPYLLSLFGWEMCVNESTDMDSIYVKNQNAVSQYFGELIKLMKETDVGDSHSIPAGEKAEKANCFYKLKELFCGQRYITNGDINDLGNLGYVILPEGGNGFLTEALQGDNIRRVKPMNEALLKVMKEYWTKDKEDIWPAMGRLEKRLRDIIHQSFLKRYAGTSNLDYNNGDYRFHFEYENVMYSEFKKRVLINHDRYSWFLNFDAAFRYLKNAYRDHHELAAKRIVDMISFDGLWNILSFYWDSCDITVDTDDALRINSSVKGMNRFFEDSSKLLLKEKFDLLNRVRNPLAHFYRECLTEKEKERAGNYCEELLSLTENYEDRV